MGDDVMVGLGAIVVLGVGMQWLSRRIRVPAILLLLASGLAAGPWLGIVDPDQIFGSSLFTLVSMAVSLLLFEGGLGLDVAELRQRGPRPVVQLVTVGVVVTWAAIAALAVPLFGLETDLAVLLGALLVVSGPTVVGPLLQLARPRQPTSTILRWEGIVIDPVGATLALVVLKVMTSGDDPLAEIVLTAVIGCGVGVVAAALLVLALRTFAVPDDLEPAVTFMVVIAAYVVGESMFQEAGLFAATALGIALANQPWVQLRRIVAFGHDVGVLVLGGLFVVLAARVTPSDFSGVIAPALGLVVVLILVVRPVVGWLCTVGTGLPAPDRWFIGGLAPRGIVAAATSSLFALQLDTAGLDDGRIEAIVFTVIVGTCLVYGLLAPPLARALGVAEPEPEGILLVGSQPWVLALADALAGVGASVTVLATGHYALAGRPRDWELLTVPAVDPALREALLGVRSAVIVSLDDEHNAVVLARCLDVLPRREVFVLPADPVPVAAPPSEVGPTGSSRPGVDEDPEELDTGMEAAPARAWERRPFGPTATQRSVEAAFGAGGLHLVADAGAVATGEVLLVVCRADGAIDLAPHARTLGPGVTAVIAGAAAPA